MIQGGASLDPREAIRTKVLAEPGFYSPWLHLAATLGSGALVIALSALAIRDLRWWDVAFAALVFVGSSGLEWIVHRFAMHRPGGSERGLYHRHAGLHHVVYRLGEMCVRDPGEFRIVLLKPWLVPAVTAALLPGAAFFAWLGRPNLGAISMMVGVGYVLLYETVHLLCHWPLRPSLAKLPILRWLRRHHALHHDPQRMRLCNFNIACPLWDAILGTLRS